MDRAHIRNFAIIAHIDHGKSTLSDPAPGADGALALREDAGTGVGRHGPGAERGITIKAHAVRMSTWPRTGRSISST